MFGIVLMFHCAGHARPTSWHTDKVRALSPQCGIINKKQVCVHTGVFPNNPSQKLLLRSYQNKLNLLAKQKSEIDVQVARVEGAMQLDMMKIATENNIDPAKFGFSENRHLCYRI